MSVRFGPPRSSNPNAYAERFVSSIKDECLNRMIFFSERQLVRVVGQLVEHYDCERNLQGLANRLIDQSREPENAAGDIVRESRLGGLLNHYRKAA